MKHKLRRLETALLCVILLAVFITIPAAAGVPASTVVNKVTSIQVLTSPIREENYFQVKASYFVSITNYGWDSEVWRSCSYCGGGGGQYIPGTSGDGGGEDGNMPSVSATKPMKITCGDTFQGRTWKCRSGCDGYDYQDKQSGMWGNVTHNTDNPWDEDHTNNWDDGKTHIWKTQTRVPCTCQMTITVPADPIPSGGGGGDSGDGGSEGHYENCPACGGSGGHYETVHHDPQEPPSTVTREIDIRVNDKVQESKKVTFHLTTTHRDGDSWTKEGTLTVTWNANADTDIGNKTVGSHIEGGNTLTTPITVIPATNLQVEFIEPNAYYRENTEVVSTFLVRNQDNIGELNIRPMHNLTAEFKAYNATGQVIGTGKQQGIVIPRQGTQLVYFKWLVPEESAGTVKLECRINTTKKPGSVGVPGVNEMDYTDNTATTNVTVKTNPIMATPDTVFENTPSWFRKPAAGDTVNYKVYADSMISSAGYQMWEWDTGTNWYKRASYSFQLSADMALSPDVNSPSHELVNEVWQMRSGYGISTVVKTSLGGNLPASDAYTSLQTASVHLPEYCYSVKKNEFRTLEAVNGEFVFRKNEAAKNDSGQSEYRRIHFTPLWYPDGNYKAEAYCYDLWTPAGMLSVLTGDTVTIDGDMYDDWYISHSKKK